MKKLFFAILISSAAITTGCGESFSEVFDELTGPVQSVSIKKNTSIVVGSTEQLYASVYPSMTANKKVTWSSNNIAVATVDPVTGVVTGVAANSSTIIIATTEEGGFTASCVVNVTPIPVPVTSVTLTPSSLNIEPGDTGTTLSSYLPVGATNTGLTWTSSNPFVVVVDQTGYYTGGINGTAIITATAAYWNISASFTVTVASLTVPPIPGAAAVTTGNGQLNISWTAVSGATSYNVYFSTVNDPNSAPAYNGLTGTTRLLTGLANGTLYYIWIKANNSAGSSGFSTVASGTPVLPLSPPGVPGAITVTAGNQYLSLSWAAVSGADSYNVFYSTTNDSSTSSQWGGDITVLNSTITGLNNGTPYYVWIRAKNSAGSGGYSVSSTGTPFVPALPTVITTEIRDNTDFTIYIAGTSARGGGEVVSDGGAPVTDRGLCWAVFPATPTVSGSHVSDAAASGTGVFSLSSMTGLTIGTVYNVRAYATNISGTAYGDPIYFDSGLTFGTIHPGPYPADTYTVFYNDGNGGGLASSTNNTYNEYWSNINNIFLSGTKTIIDSCETNTFKIVSQSGHTNSAADICWNYGNSDATWFLPSRDELRLMYNNLKVSGLGGFSNAKYWSSSENSITKAYSIDFTDGTVTTENKSASLSFKPIRRFPATY